MPNAPKPYRPLGYVEQRRNADRARGNSASRGYDARWRKARLRFLREHPLCLPCQQTGKVTAAGIVDHVLRHKGDEELFWDEGNWQPICDEHHSLKTALETGMAKRDPMPHRVVVTGPPGSGKTTWLEKHTDDSWLTWDMDREAKAQGFAARWPRPKHELRVLKIQRARLISRLMFDDAKAAIIVTGDEAEAIAGMIGAKVVRPGWCGQRA